MRKREKIGLKILFRISLASCLGQYIPGISWRISGPLEILARFITYASLLQVIVGIHHLRALALGLSLEDPEHVRATFYLALMATLQILIMNLGSLSLIL